MCIIPLVLLRLTHARSYARITRKGNDCGITTDPVLAVVEVEGEEGEEEQQKGDVAAWR